jgi:hypothetical protein
MLKYVIAGDKYVNIKKQDVYQVFQVGIHSETAETLVVYISAEARVGNTLREDLMIRLGLMFLGWASRLLRRERVWVRPIQLFEEKFTELN